MKVNILKMLEFAESGIKYNYPQGSMHDKHMSDLQEFRDYILKSDCEVIADEKPKVEKSCNNCAFKDSGSYTCMQCRSQSFWEEDKPIEPKVEKVKKYKKHRLRNMILHLDRCIDKNSELDFVRGQREIVEYMVMYLNLKKEKCDAN
jgi:hypothetical protein